LADFPSSGTHRPDIHPMAHSFPMGAYLILCRVNEQVVEIVRVLHSAHDLSLASPDFTVGSQALSSKVAIVPVRSLSTLIIPPA
jgi:hypothetical protein